MTGIVTVLVIIIAVGRITAASAFGRPPCFACSRIKSAMASMEMICPSSTILSGSSATTVFLISLPATCTILTEQSPISNPIHCLAKTPYLTFLYALCRSAFTRKIFLLHFFSAVGFSAPLAAYFRYSFSIYFMISMSLFFYQRSHYRKFLLKKT